MRTSTDSDAFKRDAVHQITVRRHRPVLTPGRQLVCAIAYDH